MTIGFLSIPVSRKFVVRWITVMCITLKTCDQKNISNKKKRMLLDGIEPRTFPGPEPGRVTTTLQQLLFNLDLSSSYVTYWPFLLDSFQKLAEVCN